MRNILILLAFLSVCAPLAQAKPAFYLPERIYAAPGLELNVYYKEIFDSTVPQNYAYQAYCRRGRSESTRWCFTPTAADAGKTYPLVINAWNDDGLVATVTSQVVVARAPADPQRTVTLALFGDSLTNCGYPDQILRDMRAAGDHRLPEKATVVSAVRGYNSWPMIQAMGSLLVCSYSRDNALPPNGHTITPGSRDSYVRVSEDGGRTWSEERTLANDPSVAEVNEGIGLDSTGAALLWVRCWGEKRRHELYRTTDGVRFEKIASLAPEPFPMQVMDIVRVEGQGLVSLWFAGDYQAKGGHSWGLLASADDGRTWTHRVIEKDLARADWMTEPSLVDLGKGRLLVVGRVEPIKGQAQSQFQLLSSDGGKTWKKSRTNITDIQQSTPSLVYDRETGLISNYYYEREARLLKRRVVRADFIAAHPDAWPEPEILDRGFEKRPWDAGNVKATRLGDIDCCAWYTGTPSNATVVVTCVPKAERK